MKSLSIGLMCLAPLGAFAQENLVVDAGVVSACLDTASWDNQHPTCIGEAAEACMMLDGGSSTFGMTVCLAEEGEIWANLLAGELGRTRATLAALDSSESWTYEPTLPKFESAQWQWQAFVGAQCNYEIGVVIDGTISGPTAAGCTMTITALRAINLRLFQGPME